MRFAIGIGFIVLGYVCIYYAASLYEAYAVQSVTMDKPIPFSILLGFPYNTSSPPPAATVPFQTAGITGTGAVS